MFKFIRDWWNGKTYYLVSYSWYEDYEPTLMYGQKVKDWEKLCDDLMPQAVEIALSKNSKISIGWPEIVESLVEALQSKGYKKIKPDEACYWGSTIICDDDNEPDLTTELIEKICKHNDKLKGDL